MRIALALYYLVLRVSGIFMALHVIRQEQLLSNSIRLSLDTTIGYEMPLDPRSLVLVTVLGIHFLSDQLK